jgi:hypothetical protein
MNEREIKEIVFNCWKIAPVLEPSTLKPVGRETLNIDSFDSLQ